MATGPEQEPIRVGVIGANPERGWALSAHIPALLALPEFKLNAVATRHLENARETAEKFDVPHAFADAAELAADPEVDLVAVTVKVPYHYELIQLALDAGKHVYSEWPLALDVEHASELAAAANEKGVRHLVGLQGMYSPGARYAHDLIENGAIGRPLAVSVVASSASSGRRTPEERIYTLEAKGGDNALTVATGHIFSSLTGAVGPVSELSGIVAAVNDSSTITETGQVLPDTAPDQVLACGRLENGAVLSVAVQGCVAPALTGFELRVVGTEGTLTARPAEPGAIHIIDWAITLSPMAGSPTAMPIPPEFFGVPEAIPVGRAENVAVMYREIGSAIRGNRAARPSFDTAVSFHRLLAAIQRSSDSGARQSLN